MKFSAVTNNFFMLMGIYFKCYMQSPFIVRVDYMYAPRFTFVQGACCLDINFHEMFSALEGVTFSWCICRAVRFPSYAYTDASPGVGSLVGGELSQSLKARLLVQFCAGWGLLVFSTAFYITHDNIMNSHVVLFVSTVTVIVVVVL